MDITNVCQGEAKALYTKVGINWKPAVDYAKTLDSTDYRAAPLSLMSDIKLTDMFTQTETIASNFL